MSASGLGAVEGCRRLVLGAAEGCRCLVWGGYRRYRGVHVWGARGVSASATLESSLVVGFVRCGTIFGAVGGGLGVRASTVF